MLQSLVHKFWTKLYSNHCIKRRLLQSSVQKSLTRDGTTSTHPTRRTIASFQLVSDSGAGSLTQRFTLPRQCLADLVRAFANMWVA